MRLGEDEQQANDEEWNDVLQVVAMRPPTPLNILVRLHLEAFSETTVFRIAHRLWMNESSSSRRPVGFAFQYSQGSCGDDKPSTPTSAASSRSTHRTRWRRSETVRDQRSKRLALPSLNGDFRKYSHVAYARSKITFNQIIIMLLASKQALHNPDPNRAKKQTAMRGEGKKCCYKLERNLMRSVNQVLFNCWLALLLFADGERRKILWEQRMEENVWKRREKLVRWV